MDLKEIFDEISTQMESDFKKAQKALQHSGLKGNANENIVKKFLRQYLPQNLDIITGTLVDSNGNQSKQLDIIICDSKKTPIFFQSNETRVIPVECAYAVIEVKAFLDKTELQKSYDNMLSVKTLEKKAYFTTNGPLTKTFGLYGKQWSHWPIQHFVFAFDSSGLESVSDNLLSLQFTNENHKKIDLICVLKKGVILNKTDDERFSPLPTPGSYHTVSKTSEPLLLFYTLISIVLNQVNMDRFNLMEYLKGMTF